MNTDLSTTKSTRPLVFLDFDDVICTNDPYGGYDVMAPKPPVDLWEKLFNPVAVATLLTVIEQHDPEVVITSSWLRFMDRDAFEVIFAKTGMGPVAQALHSVWEAPQHRSDDRRCAIEGWLKKHHQGQAFAILDDKQSGTGLAKSRWDKAGRVVLCEIDRGLHAGMLGRIAAALTRPPAAKLFANGPVARRPS